MPLGKRDRTNLETVISGIQQRWGPDILRVFGKPDAATEVPHIATGFAALDRALGIGGVPRGHITEILGAPTSGMSTLAFRIVANAHAAGDMAVYVDPGKTFDADYAVRCGID